eukprot:s2060_g8.t2
MASPTWQANLMSADEAMLGGIPDREAPLPALPHIPKAVPSVLSRAEFQEVVLQRTNLETASSLPLGSLGCGAEVSNGRMSPTYPTLGGVAYPSSWRSVPAPLEPAWRGAEAGRSFSSRAPLGWTIHLEQGLTASGPSHVAQEVRPASSSAASGTAPAVATGGAPSPYSVGGTSAQLTTSKASVSTAVSSMPPCRSVQFVNAQASFASVVPAVIAPSSPCFTPCGTPQSPCRSASVVPAVAPSSPCMTQCRTPQSPCRSVQFVNPQATLLTSASVVPAVVAPSSPCMTQCRTSQSPCRAPQFVPQASPGKAVAPGLVASPCGVHMFQVRQPSASPAPVPLRSRVWTRRSPQASQGDRSSSPLKCLPVKYSRQDRDRADPPQDFESLMAEARLRLKEKVDGVVSQAKMPPLEVSLLPSKPRTADPEEMSSRSRLEPREDNEPPKSAAPSLETRAELASLAKLEALLAKSSTDESGRRPQRKSPAPSMESTDFPSLAKLEALLAETSKSDSPRRRPSDLLRKSAPSQELASTDVGAPTGKCSSHRSQRSQSSSAPESVPSRDLAAGDDYLRRPLFVGSKEASPLSRSASEEDQWLYKSWRSPSRSSAQEWLSNQDRLEGERARSSLVKTQSVPTLVQGPELNEPKVLILWEKPERPSMSRTSTNENIQWRWRNEM